MLINKRVLILVQNSSKKNKRHINIENAKEFTMIESSIRRISIIIKEKSIKTVDFMGEAQNYQNKISNLNIVNIVREKEEVNIEVKRVNENGFD